MAENKQHQFDFWLGTWEVTWGEHEHGTNRIERILDGMIIQENFDGRPSLAMQGMSVSVFDSGRDKWCQTWVDSQGSYLDFTGEFRDDSMVLMRETIMDSKPIKQRMRWYNIATDELDWNWEQSEDNGQTWTLLWHIHYHRK